MSDGSAATAETKQAFAATEELRPADAESTCLRPLGLCELGGCCDVCWYRPDHPRFQVDPERTHD